MSLPRAVDLLGPWPWIGGKGFFELLGEGRGKERRDRKVGWVSAGGLLEAQLNPCCEGLSLSSTRAVQRQLCQNGERIRQRPTRVWGSEGPHFRDPQSIQKLPIPGGVTARVTFPVDMQAPV